MSRLSRSRFTAGQAATPRSQRTSSHVSGLSQFSARGSAAFAAAAAGPTFPSEPAIAFLGDSMGARSSQATTAGVRTTILHRGNSELMWALGITPLAKHVVYWDPGATAALDIPTYGFASAQDNLYRGLNFGYSGDTMLGITRRTAQVIAANADLCYVSAGTNTDTPNTAVEKIARLDEAITALIAGGVHVLLGTIRPRSSGERSTLTDVASITLGSHVVRIVHANHGLTNTSGTTKSMDFIGAGLSVGGKTISGLIMSGSGGYTVNIVDVNTIDITVPGAAATSTVANGGGEFTYYRNVFIDLAGTNNVGNCVMPSDPRHVTHLDTNTWVLAQAGRTGVKVVDMTAAMRDPALSAITGVYLEADRSMIMDGVHLSPKGAYACGLVISAALATLISGTAFDPDPAVLNLLSSGNFSGTPVAAGAGFTGTVPGGCSVSNINGAGQPVTGVASIEANPNTGGNSSVLVITSSGAGSANTFNEIRFAHPAVTAGFVSTDWVQMFYQLEFAGMASGIMPAYQATIGMGSTISARGLGQTRADYNTEPYPERNGLLWIETSPLLIEARTSLAPILRLSIRTDLAGSVTVKVHRAILRLVPDPTVAYPWVP